MKIANFTTVKYYSKLYGCVIVMNFQVFQKRVNGSMDFYKNYFTYEAGFGSVSGEFWLGNISVRRRDKVRI